MRELTLKDIVGYLPYGLRVIYAGNRNEEMTLHFLGIVIGYREGGSNLDLMKPILRPLSDLTKEIEVNGEIKTYKRLLRDISSVKGMSATTFNGIIRSLKYNGPKNTPYWIIEKLYEWKLDLNGLIESGLAIDINTLPQPLEK